MPSVSGRRLHAEARWERKPYCFQFDGLDRRGAVGSKSRSTYFPNDTAAHAYLLLLQADVQRRDLKPPDRSPNPSRKSTCPRPSRGRPNKWTDEQLPDVTPMTREGYTAIVKRHLIPGLGDILLVDLDADDVNRFYRAQEKRLSKRTVLHEHRCLHRALESAVANKVLPANPITSAVRRPRPEHIERNWLDDAGITELLKEVRGREDLETAVILAVRAG